MAKIVTFLTVALLLGVALGYTPAASSASISASAFNQSALTQVFSVANTTDNVAAKWPAATGTTVTIPYTGVIFGPGADNTTVWAYGFTYTVGTPSSAGSITAVVQRKLNSTMVAWGNDTTESSVIQDYQATLGTAIAQIQTPKFAVGVGYVAAVTVTGGAAGGTTTQSISISIFQAGSTSPTTVSIASGADTSSTSQDYNVYSVWAEDSAFYVVYGSVAGSISGSGTAVNSWAETLYTQGVYFNGTKLYTAPVSTTVTSGAQTGYIRGSATTFLGSPKAGGSNYTNSTYINIVYKVSGSSNKVSSIQVTRSTGAPGSAVSLNADVASGANTAGNTYTPAGTFYSNITSGVLVANVTVASNAQNAASTYTLLVCYNGTATCADSGLTFSNANAAVTAQGTAYNNTYYLLLASYPTSSSGMGYVYQTYMANGTAAGASATSVGTDQGLANLFRDSINALWIGYDTYDTTSGTTPANSVYAGYLGRLVYSVFPTTSSFGNVLTSFFAILTLLLASILAF